MLKCTSVDFDKWKEEELEEFNEDQLESPPSDSILVEPFSLYKELGVRIKKGLLCSRTASP